MIDYKYLMIGNYVKIYNGEVYQIQSIYCDCVDIVNSDNSIEKIMCDRIYPIEVTDELLVKLGFKHLLGGIGVIKYFSLLMDEIDIIVNNYNNIYFCSLFIMRKQLGCFDFKYLHELQNGIRLITKRDLEIKL